MIIYRRRIKSDCWHFVSACRWWPRGATPKLDAMHCWFKTSRTKPKSGELCNECRVKARRK